MEGKIRRVVTGHDSKGRAIVISDGLAPAVRTNPLRPGHVSVDLWKTSASPVILAADEPDPTLGPKQIHPPSHGTIVRISEIAPETEAIRNLPPDQARQVFKSMGNEEASTFGRGGRHPFMHRTESIDYAVVLAGEIVLLLDDEDVHLKAGDVVIQRGTNHAWSNRSASPAVVAIASHDGKW
jgi:quercetin dioxygenase-like cupin family protein